MYDQFFDYTKARYAVYLKKQNYDPWPWSDDPILNNNYFTNIYREDDKTTVWFRENVRRDLQLNNIVLPATMLFRWFNRIDIGETIFCQYDFDRQTVFTKYMEDFDRLNLRRIIKQEHPYGPYVNAAYIIKGWDGMDKLSGVVYAFHEAMGTLLKEYGSIGNFCMEIVNNASLEWTTKELQKCKYLGPFMAYEIVCDLRWTLLLSHANDINIWANPGPGARRGLNRIHGRPLKHRVPTHQCIVEMRHILEAAWDKLPDMPKWEMREVEHTLCEFDKYERVRLGQGRSKRNYP